MQTRQEKIAELAKLMFRAAPEFRKTYARPIIFQGGTHMSLHRLFCLFILKRQHRASMTMLAEKLGVSNQQLTRIVTELVEKGLAERTTDESNRRIVYISLTDKGEEETKNCFHRWLGHIEQHLAPLSDEELDTFLYHMSEIIKLQQKIDR